MKKYIIGFILGAVLFSSGVVFAKTIVNTTSWYYVDSIKQIGSYKYSLDKTYDEETNVVCYSFRVGNAGGISCLKNN